jgi:hypothetical protein
MTLKEALAKIADACPVDDAMKSDEEAWVCSGGTKNEADDAPPALFLRSSAAVESWCDQVLALIEKKKPAAIKFMGGKPDVDLWRITMADSMQTHRIANDRYAVSTLIGLKLG